MARARERQATTRLVELKRRDGALLLASGERIELGVLRRSGELDLLIVRRGQRVARHPLPSQTRAEIGRQAALLPLAFAADVVTSPLQLLGLLVIWDALP